MDLVLHQRAALACTAAVTLGLPGEFRVWPEHGLLAVLATDPALGFLSSVTGLTAAAVPAAAELAGSGRWPAPGPALILPAGDEEAVAAAVGLGLVREPDRGVAVREIAGPEPTPAGPTTVVTDVAAAAFVPVLVAGYGVAGTVASFIAAEHAAAGVHRLVAIDDGRPVGAAAMTVHGGVAVFGGASTLPASRRRGVQGQLLRHRLALAAALGCTAAVATVVPGSTSAANLARAGFDVRRRPTFRLAQSR